MLFARHGAPGVWGLCTVLPQVACDFIDMLRHQGSLLLPAYWLPCSAVMRRPVILAHLVLSPCSAGPGG